MKNSNLRFLLFVTTMLAIGIAPCAYHYTTQRTVEIEEEWIEETEDIIRWRIDDEYEEEQIFIEEVVTEIVKEPLLKSIGTFKLTAYCPCEHCSGQWGHQTSTGTIATEGKTVAVDTKVIPYGTVLVINGKEYVAEDCGSAIINRKIDIFFESHQAALEFGVQYAEIFIKEIN